MSRPAFEGAVKNVTLQLSLAKARLAFGLYRENCTPVDNEIQEGISKAEEFFSKALRGYDDQQGSHPVSHFLTNEAITAYDAYRHAEEALKLIGTSEPFPQILQRYRDICTKLKNNQIFAKRMIDEIIPFLDTIMNQLRESFRDYLEKPSTFGSDSERFQGWVGV